MALTLSLKPGEKAIIGGAVISNDDERRIRIMVNNNVPVLREKDIIKPERVDTPCKRLYFAIQLMYIDQANLADYHKTYWRDAEDVVKAAPSCFSTIETMGKHIVAGEYYKALKLCKELIDYEKKLLKHANRSGADHAEPL
ncbi:MAG: flagellar biosynthesis repressor FlbT [Syntrophorhabdus sp. PtaU1.Bin153]|nr:MAG: flagellar biosynthesis repressor FlbT [Syntrophorhabdus sp. PtaU1.Bin153]